MDKPEIILVNTKSNTYRLPEENMGLEYIKSFLDTKKIPAVFIDGFITDQSNDLIMRRIKQESNIILVGLALHIDSQGYVADMLKRIKRLNPSIYTCVGGHVASFSDVELLNTIPELDFVIRGEGEFPIVDLYRCLVNRRRYDRIKNLTFRRGGRIVSNPCRPLIKDLDILPFPDRSYTKLAIRQGCLVHISASRGCYGNCTFCSINSLYRLSRGEIWRGRSPKNTVDEIERLVKQLNVKVFKFVDDSFFSGGPDWRIRPFQFANELIKRRLRIKFRISCRVNNIEEELFAKLKKAGLYSLSLGVESASLDSLRVYNKGITPQQSDRAIKILQKLKIDTLAGFIGFEPYMKFAAVKENYRFLLKHTYCFFDIVSKPLFVHSNDPITQKLIADNLIAKRVFPNYLFRYVDPQVKKCHDALEFWSSFNRQLYYRVIDPISSPRLMTPKQKKAVLQIYRTIRNIDLQVYGRVIEDIENGVGLKIIKKKLANNGRQHGSTWKQMDRQLDKIGIM